MCMGVSGGLVFGMCIGMAIGAAKDKRLSDKMMIIARIENMTDSSDDIIKNQVTG